MKVAIMQPYLFPYLGYFQLINAVDKFVIHDDVQYIKGGWINRNRILVNNKDYLFTLSIKKQSHKLNINKRFFSEESIKQRYNLLKIIDFSYKRAPYYNDESKKLFQSILDNGELNLNKMISRSLINICKYLRISTCFISASDLLSDKKLKGQEKVMCIVKSLDGNHYINPVGGVNLYSKEIFKKNGIKLNFLNTKNANYRQFNNSFIPNLSVIDVIMFNSKEKIKEMLSQYSLL